MNDKVKTVYIAGPITGDPKYKSKFSAAADLLMQDGYAVINPVKAFWHKRHELRHELLYRCFKLVANVDCLFLLPEWEESEGANAELQVFIDTHCNNADVLISDHQNHGFSYVCKNIKEVDFPFPTYGFCPLIRATINEFEKRWVQPPF